MKNAIRYFVQELLLIEPLAVTLVVIVKIISMIGSIFSSMGIIIHPLIDPFIVLAAAILLIVLAGFMGSLLFFKPLFTLLERALDKAPLIKIIYSSIKDFLSAFVGNKKRFNKPVLIDINKENGIQSMGFITQTSLLEMGIKNNKVAVYIPLSYAFSGNLLIVPAENVTPLDLPASEAMKFIVSGGVSEIEESKPVV